MVILIFLFLLELRESAETLFFYEFISFYTVYFVVK